MKILILIIGGNPISNYGIIKRSLLNDKDDSILPKVDKVALIYTEQTKKSADNFKTLFKEVEFIDINIKDKARSLKDIEQIVKSTLKKEKITFLHLNYTGGTKSMSIGAYLAANSLNVEHKIFSDIGMDKKLYLKRGDVYPRNGTIIDNLTIKVEEILKLNGINASFKTKNSEFYSREFAKFLMDKSINDVKKFFEDLWDKDFKELKELNWSKSLKNAPINSDNISNKKLKPLQKFIKGLWLEEYLFDILSEYKKEIGFDDIAINLEIKDNNQTQVEIDLVLTKGYDVYIFSCTTAAKKGVIKQKAFEANLRAEQLGGIGAKPVLVSLADSDTLYDLVEKDMKFYIGKRKFEALGKSEIEDKDKLLNRLKEIIK